MKKKIKLKTGWKRLLKLADFLETKVPKNRFNMERWLYDPKNNKRLARGKALLEIKGPPQLHNCGYKGCAIGWATNLFARDGFRPQPWGTPEYKVWAAEGAISRFFDMELYEVGPLFIPEKNGAIPRYSPKTVAKQIRAYVKRKLNPAKELKNADLET